jgi:transposase
VSNGSGLSRGDRNRNERISRLRELVPHENAIAAIDLADDKQMVVVTDHDSKVLARKTYRTRAWKLGAALDWAAEHAAKAGFAGVTVSCEPTGHRWRVVGQLAADRSMPFVCVQGLLVHQARESEDFTRDKTDDRDAVLIARLTAKLHCYLPEDAEESWARLRHLGARRWRLMDDDAAQRLQLRAWLECAWPAVLDTSSKLFKSATWCAALAVVADRCNGDLNRVKRLGAVRFENAVRRELPRWGKKIPCLRIVRKVFAALSDPAGVTAQRRGALERVHLVLGDWRETRRRLADVEARMVAVLDELEFTDLVATIPGVSPVSSAAILAESGDPTRFARGRAVVKHAGLAPRECLSGKYAGRTRLSGRGRPGLRTAAWRAAWGAVRGNPVYAAKYTHLTTREKNRLKPGQAQAVIAAAILRQLHAVITRREAWNAAIAGGAGQVTVAA